jgi:hypothetical protein
MQLPGFTAEDSLDRRSGRHWMIRTVVQAPGTIKPAFSRAPDCYDRCVDQCIEGDPYCWENCECICTHRHPSECLI